MTQAKNESIIIDDNAAGRRIDRFLSEYCKDHSRAQLQKLIANQHILLNNQPCSKGVILKTGDEVQINWPDEKRFELKAENINLDIIFNDDDIIVINKPPNMTVHPGAGTHDGTLVNALLGYDYENFHKMIDDEVRPGIVHRLDKDTSGLIIVAKHQRAKTKLGEAFANREVSKTYLAICHNYLEDYELEVKNYIGRHPVNRKQMAVVTKNGKLAHSHFSIIDESEHQLSLIKARIFTGRTHQIRVHLKSLNCPIVGDQTYGSKKAAVTAERQLLHAWQLELKHPCKDENIYFKAPLPADFKDIMNRYDLGFP